MRSVSKWAGGLAVAVVLTGSAGLVAQDLDVGELLNGVKSAVEAKKYGKALAELNLLVGEVTKLRIESLKKTLEAAVKPSGWTGEEATGEGSGQIMIAAGITIRKRFTKGEKGMQVELLSDSPMVGMIAPLLSNPAMLQGREGVSVVTLKGGRRGVLEYRGDSKSGNLQVLLNNNAILKFDGDGVDRADILEAFGKGADLDAIERELQN